MTLTQAMTAPLAGLSELELNEARRVVGEEKRQYREAEINRAPKGGRFEQFTEPTLKLFAYYNRRLDAMLVEDMTRQQTPKGRGSQR